MAAPNGAVAADFVPSSASLGFSVCAWHEAAEAWAVGRTLAIDLEPPRYLRAALLAVLWGACLGATGFVCGYFGNGVLAADPGTVAPLLGFFVTGPYAAAVGVAIGGVLGASSKKPGYLLVVFFFSLLLTAVTSLVLASPGYGPEAQLVEGHVERCISVSSLIPSRTRHWQSEADRVTREKLVDVRRDWQQSVPAMVGSRPGVVLELNTQHVAWYEERAWRGGRVDRRIRRFQRQARHELVFFDAADANCQGKVASLRRVSTFCLGFEPSDGYPPTGLPEFLGIWVAHEVPESIASGSKERLSSWITRTCKR